MLSLLSIALAVLICTRLERAQAFAIQREPTQQQQSHPMVILRRQYSHGVIVRASSNEAADSTTKANNEVSTQAFLQAIQTLGDEPEKDARVYSIRKLTANLPIEHAGGLSLADCDTMVLVQSITKDAANETGIQPLDTIVGVAANDFAGTVSFGNVMQEPLSKVAEVYTKTIEYAYQNGFKSIELQVQRLVTDEDS